MTAIYDFVIINLKRLHLQKKKVASYKPYTWFPKPSASLAVVNQVIL